DHQRSPSGPDADPAHGMRSIWLDTELNIWPDTLVVTLSEFGRTSMENGSFGTDHAEASCMFAAGGQVIGGVYNCDAVSWPQGSMFLVNNRYLSHLTDFRTVLAEVIDRFFNASTNLDAIIPGWSGLSGPTYNYLNFLPSP
ncbi:MAG: DUF1501 domain-containing protein, partial [Planctomycetota bacterium]